MTMDCINGVDSSDENLGSNKAVPIGDGSGVASCKLSSLTVGGHVMDIAIQYFGNTPFIIVTEFQKVGSLFHIIPDTPVPGESMSYHIRVLMGESKPEMMALGEILARKMPRSFGSMILSLALKAETYKDTVAIKEMIRFITTAAS